jgi:four helix bundle protein
MKQEVRYDGRVNPCDPQIVEGYGRRIYKADYIKFIVYALSSNDETIDHLETLYETKSLTDDVLYKQLLKEANTLGRKLNNFLQALIRGHNKPDSYTGD